MESYMRMIMEGIRLENLLEPEREAEIQLSVWQMRNRRAQFIRFKDLNKGNCSAAMLHRIVANFLYFYKQLARRRGAMYIYKHLNVIASC